MKIENLHFSYGSHEVLKGVSFGVEGSGFVSVLGPNGAGKSTLFRCILGLLEPSEGSVHICGRNIRQMPPAELSHRVAYIPQSHTPVFNFSVFDMVLMGTTAQLSRFSSPGKKEAQLAEAAMERIGISHLRDRGSGNEVTMEQIALWDPELILFDTDSIYDTVADLDTWNTLSAIAGHNYLEVPESPWNWLGTPSAAQRYLGMIWLTAQLYPEYCDYDPKAEILEFYDLFYHCRLTQQQYEALTANAFVR